MQRRALSVRQAMKCENATEPRCTCRCGGAAHGKGRIQDPSKLQELPPEDPHRPQSFDKRAVVRMLKRIRGIAYAEAVPLVPVGLAVDTLLAIKDTMARAIESVRSGSRPASVGE